MRKSLLQILITIIIASGLLGGIIGASVVLLEQKSTATFMNSRTNTTEPTITNVVEKTSPAVVSVISEDTDIPDTSQPFPPTGTVGSGFVVSPDGVVLTSYHVVNDPNISYVVVTNENKRLPIKKIDRNKEYDIALVYVDAKNMPTLTLGDSDTIRPGQTIIAIGNAFGSLENTITVGVISGLNRSIIASDQDSGIPQNLSELIQIDAAINPGNSGGPLLNLNGEVIGVNIAGSSAAQNIGFAIPINKIKQILPSVSGAQSRSFF